jgi:hypothetical protein
MSDQEDVQKIKSELQTQATRQHGNLDLQKMLSELETQATADAINATQKVSMTGTANGPYPESDEDIKKSPFIAPAQPEVLALTTKIHSFDKPVFMTLPKSKVYTIFGDVPVLRTPEVSTNYVEMHVINDDEMGYCIPQSSLEDNDYGIIFDDGGTMSMLHLSVYVVCGKKFGTRKLEALASILLKLNAQQIIVQKYSYNKSNRSAQWVPEYNKKVTKLEHHIHKFLRNDDQ